MVFKPFNLAICTPYFHNTPHKKVWALNLATLSLAQLKAWALNLGTLSLE